MASPLAHRVSRMAVPLPLVALSAALLGAAVAMAGADVAIEWCLLVLALVPWVTVIGYELVGHRHNAQVLADLAD